MFCPNRYSYSSTNWNLTTEKGDEPSAVSSVLILSFFHSSHTCAFCSTYSRTSQGREVKAGIYGTGNDQYCSYWYQYQRRYMHPGNRYFVCQKSITIPALPAPCYSQPLSKYFISTGLPAASCGPCCITWLLLGEPGATLILDKGSPGSPAFGGKPGGIIAEFCGGFFISPEITPLSFWSSSVGGPTPVLPISSPPGLSGDEDPEDEIHPTRPVPIPLVMFKSEQATP